ncbi:hypothetical protein BD560DRAFT_441618 [Blakeslea trispora]|nr:hypothetical protein BD560DRAFT_441618 [Blakeslea trispora]
MSFYKPNAIKPTMINQYIQFGVTNNIGNPSQNVGYPFLGSFYTSVCLPPASPFPARPLPARPPPALCPFPFCAPFAPHDPMDPNSPTAIFLPRHLRPRPPPPPPPRRLGNAVPVAFAVTAALGIAWAISKYKMYL